MRMGIGQAIEDLRVAAGFDQGTLAAKAKLRQADISHFENETRSPRVEQVLAIEKACKARPGSAFVLAGFVADISDVEEAILADGKLPPSLRDALVRQYRALLESPQAEARRR